MDFQLSEGQFRKVNRMLLVTVLIITVFGAVGLLAQLRMTEIALWRTVLPLVLLLLNGAAVIVLDRSRDAALLHKFESIAFMVVYAALLFLGASNATYAYIFPVILVFVFYLNVNMITGTAVITMIINVAIAVIDLVTKGMQTAMEGAMTEVIATLAICGAAVLGVRIIRGFMAENAARIQEEAEKSQETAKKILDASKTIISGVKDLEEKMQSVSESTASVSEALDQVNKGNTDSVTTVESQTNMTSDINGVVEKAFDLTKNASESSQSMQEALDQGYQDMEGLADQAGQTTEVGKSMQDAAARLQGFSGDAKKITDMILTISSQTNLLALNASIEAARAGEAGKGFAVVADQIGKLASQTKESTEQITGLLEELAAGSDDVAEKSKQTVEMADHQQSLADETRTFIGNSRDKAEELADVMSRLQEGMNEIKASTAKILESTSTLLASSEEISASTTEALQMSRDNVDKVKSSNEILDQIAEVTREL